MTTALLIPIVFLVHAIPAWTSLKEGIIKMFKKLNAKIAGLGAACIVACALLGSATTISAATHSVALNPQPLPPGKAIVKCAEYGCL